MNRALVLGGDGFIGGSFACMQKSHNDIQVISRKKSAYIGNEIVCSDPFNLKSTFFNDTDIVYNFFGLAHRSDTTNKDLFYKINYDLVVSLAQKAKFAGVKKFIHMSSISVYGQHEEITKSTPEKPITHYGKSKLLADKALLELVDDSFKVLILRPPMIYGIGAPGNMQKLISLIRILPILPFKNANEKRSFLCIDNFLILLEKAIKLNLEGIQLLCDIKSFSTRELVELIMQGTGTKKRLINLPFKSAIKTFLPTYYRKLFGSLTVESNLSWDGVANYKDPSQILIEMAQKATF